MSTKEEESFNEYTKLVKNMKMVKFALCLAILVRNCIFNVLIYIDLGKPKSGAPGLLAQNPIKLTHDEQEFRFEFCNFAVRFSVYCLVLYFRPE